MLLGPDRFVELQKTLLGDFRSRPLSVESFIGALTAAGLENSESFFDAWVQADALIGAAVRSIAPGDGGDYEVVVSRSGTVPYPIPVSMVMPDGATHEVTLAAHARADTFRVDSRPEEVLFDSTGVISMWNASHPRLRELFIDAALAERLDGLGIPLAKQHLAAHPENDRIRSLLVARLESAGRTPEAEAYRRPGSG